MSVKHIDFLRIKPSKFLVVEVRPIRCVIDSPSGPTRTAKWMNHNHWKELRGLLNDIADVYEEQRNSMKVTQNVQCNKAHIKIGSTLKIGYMFNTFQKCSCYYLTPRDNEVWTDDDDDNSGKELKDKGGRYDSIVPCGETLVVSVTLLDSSACSEQGLRERAIGNHYDGGKYDLVRSKTSSIHNDWQLLKTLDSSVVFTNTISDYFESSQSLSTGSSVSNQVCTRTNEDFKSKRQKTLRNMVSKSRSTTKKQKKLSTAMQSTFENENFNSRQVLKSIFDTQSDDSSEPCEENPFTMSRQSKYFLENFKQNETKASYSDKLFYSDGGVLCTHNQVLVHDLESQKKKIDIQKECNQNELLELTESNDMKSDSYNDDTMRNLNELSPHGMKENTSNTSNNLKETYDVEYEQTYSSENGFNRSENELYFTRSYSNFSNFDDKSTKLQDFKVACSATNDNNNSNIGKFKALDISSPPISPVLGISRSQVTEHSSDSSLFHPQVGDQREGETETKDLGTQNHIQNAYRREEWATHSDMSKSLLDIKKSPVLEVKIPLERIDNQLTQYGIIQDRVNNPKSAEMNRYKRAVKAKRKKEESIRKLFGDHDITEGRTKIHLLDSEQKITQQNILDPYVEEEYIPEQINSECKKNQYDFSSFVPKYNPSPTVSQYSEESYENPNDALIIRRSRRIREKEILSSSEKKSLSDTSTVDSTVSFSPSSESDVASLISNKPSKLENKSTGTLRKLNCSKEGEVKNNDISPKKFKAGNMKCEVKKDISPSEVGKKKVASKTCKLTKTHLSKQTLKSMKDLEKCRKVIEQLEKKRVNKVGKLSSTNNFGEESDRCINVMKRKGKGKILSFPKNQPKVTDWISSRHKYCKRNKLLRRKSVGEESEKEKKSNFCFGVKNSYRIQEVSHMDDLDRASKYNCAAEYMTLFKENISETLNNQEDYENSEEDDISENGTTETQNNLMHTEINEANSGEDTIMPPSKEDSPEDKTSKDPSLKSLIHSYNRLQQMTIEELKNRLKQAIPYLRRVAKGQEPSKRHQVFKNGGREMQQMSDELIYGPYTEDQITCVIDMLSKKFLTVQDHDNQYKWRQYIWKVLAPTLLIKIVMDNEEITQDSAEKLLVEFSLNREIRGSDNFSPI